MFEDIIFATRALVSNSSYMNIYKNTNVILMLRPSSNIGIYRLSHAPRPRKQTAHTRMVDEGFPTQDCSHDRISV